MRGARLPRGGWRVVAGLAVAEPVSWGVLYYAFAVVQGPMGADLGWGRTRVTGGFSLALLVSGLAAVPVGWWVDRRGARGPMTAGAALGVAAVVAWSRVGSVPAYYAAMALAGLAMAGTLYEPAFAAVARWFPADPGRALTAVTLGGALAGPVFLPLTSELVDRLGWRDALVALAALLALMPLPLHALVVRDPARVEGGADPEPGGGHPPAASGDVVPTSTRRRRGKAATEGRHYAHPRSLAVPPQQVTLRGALRTPAFWWLTLSLVLGAAAVGATTVQLVPYLTGRGSDPTVAATALGLSTGLAFVGRLLVAPLGGRVGHRALLAGIGAAQGVGIVCLVTLGEAGVWLFVGLAGAAGAATPVRAALVAELFGTSGYGAIAGATALARTLTVAAAPVGSSLVVAALGGYDALLWGLAGGCLLAAGAVLRTGPGPGGTGVAGAGGARA